MLEFNLNGTVLEVKEALMSFTDTKVSYWYYDVYAWLRSLTGKQHDAPSQPMIREEIEWVRTYYLPKALAPKAEPAKSQYDPKAHARYARVTASMEADEFYEGHTREECAVEWRRRYDALRAA